MSDQVGNQNVGFLMTRLKSIIVGIENEMNWHGKPLSAKAEESIKVIKGQMSKQEDWGLRPQPITTKVPAVDLTNIKLSEPPNYKIGQQV